MDKPDVDRMIKSSRDRMMTPAERREQRRSFAYGNCRLANDPVTRELVDKADDDFEAAREQGR